MSWQNKIYTDAGILILNIFKGIPGIAFPPDYCKND